MRPKPLAGLAALAVLLATAVPAAARTHCPTERIVTRSASAVVVARGPAASPGTRYYGCLTRVKKVFRLNQSGEYGLNLVHRATIRLAGRYLAYEQDWGSGAGGALNTISVRDLVTGVVIHQAYVSRRGADLGDSATDIVLKGTGSVAWIAGTDEQGTFTLEVRAMTRATRKGKPGGPITDDPALFDAGPDIGPRSLVLSRDRTHVSWTHGDESRSAPLP